MPLQKISITLQKDCDPQSVFSKLEFFGLQNAILKDFTILGEAPDSQWTLLKKIPGVTDIELTKGFQ